MSPSKDCSLLEKEIAGYADCSVPVSRWLQTRATTNDLGLESGVTFLVVSGVSKLFLEKNRKGAVL